MVTKKCPKCGRIAQVRVERTFKAMDHRSTYSCAVCGSTWTTTNRPERKPPKRKHGLVA
jgi:transposase-like protein